MTRRSARLLAAGLVALALGSAVVAAVALLAKRRSGGSAAFAGARYLDVDLHGSLPELPAEDLSTLFESGPRRSVRAFVEALDRAARDGSVRGVVLRIGPSDAGWARLGELRAAIGRFRKTGKPVYAHLESGGNAEYYLASACDRIFAVPTGILDVSGLSSEVTFFAGTFEKLGVEAQFEGVGKYKNAPNQYTERGFTEPHREQMEALVGSLYEQYLAAIAAGRHKSRDEAQALVDGGPYDARQAVAAGLVDELVYADELEGRFKDASRLTVGRYLRSDGPSAFDSRPRLALVYVVGEIASGRSSRGGLGGDVAGSDSVAAAIRKAREDEGVRALVVRIDSPGGSGVASDVIWRELRLTAARKPVVASMGDVAASGGYYVAMGADAIVAEPGTITGSIGVFGGKFSLRGLYDKLGLSKEIVSRGRNAALFTDYRPWSDEERAHVRGLMTAFYREFVSKVAERRGRSFEEIHAVAQGRVWSGSEAVERGLADRLGGLGEAVALAKERAHVAADQEVALQVLPEPRGFWEMLSESDDQLAEVGLLPAEARRLMGFALRAGPGPLARLPFELRIR